MRIMRKQGKRALTPHTKVKNTLPVLDIKTAVNICHIWHYCIINNVAFAKVNTKETFDAIKN